MPRDNILNTARPGLVAVACVVGPMIGAAILLANTQGLTQYLREGTSVGLVLWGVCVITCALAMMPTHAASLMAGFALGLPWGVGLAWSALFSAAVLGFVLGGRLSGSGWIEAVEKRERLARVHHALLRSGTRRSVFIIMLLRLSPMLPFAMTNAVLAAVGVRPGAFMLGSALGLAPRITAVTFLGAGLAELDLRKAGSIWMVLPGVIATGVLLVVVSVIASRALRRID